MQKHTAREINPAKLPPVNFDFAGFARWRNPSMHFAVEVGCGVGLHPIRWAQARTDGQILAIERTHEKFAKFARRLRHHPGLDNVWAAHADANVLLPQLLNANSVDEYFMLYPNPEPKAPNRRLGLSPLLKFISSSLRPGGVLNVATNIESYARELAAHAPGAGFARIDLAPIANDFTPRSHFEKKYLARNESCWNLILKH